MPDQDALDVVVAQLLPELRAEIGKLFGPAAEVEALRRKKTLTTEEVERVYGLNAGTLRNKRSRGEGPRYISDGRCILYRPEDVDEYLSDRVMKTHDQQ